MPKADVMQLVQLLSAGQQDATVAEREYHNVLLQFAQQAEVVQLSVVPVLKGQPTVEIPEGDGATLAHGVKLLSVLYDDVELSESKVHTLNMLYGEGWRALQGRPRFYVREEQDGRVVRLVPKPDTAGDAWSPPWGDGLGRDYPRYCVVMLHTAVKALDDAPRHLDLGLALTVLSHTFHEESAVRDPVFAGMCRTLAAALQKVVL